MDSLFFDAKERDWRDRRLTHVIRGIEKLRENKRNLAFFVLLNLVIVSITHYMIWIKSGGGLIPLFVEGLVFVLQFQAMRFLLADMGTPIEAREIEGRMDEISLNNQHGYSPLLIKVETNDPTTTYTFDADGIPLCDWQNKQEKLEHVFRERVLKVEQGPFINYVTVTTSSVKGLSTSPIWTADATPSEDFELALGQGYEGPVTVNLANIPHILLGGSTGSGKTVLLKCLIAQAIQKHAVVHIADFKGRVDFPYVWDNYCDFYLDETSLLQELIDLVNCLEWRKAEFRKHSVANIDAYNSTTGSHLQRHILACDEIAEFLDMRGLDKEHKDLVYQIINRLSVIARQGRAFGIHLILATQRPDADILPGQIKNNLDCRICGRADRILSQIILDNSDAASAIPKDSRGRFLMNDGTEFQGYYMDDIPMAAELDSYRNAHKFD